MSHKIQILNLLICLYINMKFLQKNNIIHYN